VERHVPWANNRENGKQQHAKHCELHDERREAFLETGGERQVAERQTRATWPARRVNGVGASALGE
jgi:hypothetical protein